MDTSLNHASPFSLVRALKGAPLSLLFAMRLAGQPVGEGWLVQVTGYSSITVRHALEYLAEIGLAQRNGRYGGWVLLDTACQLILAAPGEALPASDAANGALTVNAPVPATATALIEETSQSSSSSSSSQALTVNARSLQALKAAGIGDPTASYLASQAYVTPEYVKAHVQKAKEDGISTGLLIHRMRQNDPAPETHDRAIDLERSWGICPHCHRRPCMCSED